jgi:hypothetical protein
LTPPPKLAQTHAEHNHTYHARQQNGGGQLPAIQHDVAGTRFPELSEAVVDYQTTSYHVEKTALNGPETA